MTINAVLLDIEGTTTPISFVYEVLFPYACRRMDKFLHIHQSDPEIKTSLELLKMENSRDTGAGAPRIEESNIQDPISTFSAYCLWLISQDRKSTPLKTIQGRIWEQGFINGELRGEVFPDVAPALKTWHSAGRTVSVYSSGSVLAQNLLFKYSSFGDLTPYISSFFDTHIGPKRSSESYAAIMSNLQCEAGKSLFVSDVPEELNAAESAGWCTVLSIRPGNPTVGQSGSYRTLHSFDELVLD